MKKLSVPAMFSKEYIQILNELNKNSKNGMFIYEVYGSIPNGPVGTIRPSDTLPKISKEYLLEYIKELKKTGIKFNYVMNSTVLDGSEYIAESRKEIISFIDEMVKAGLSGITVSVPFLIKLIRKNFKELKITASICMEINSVQGVKDVLELGADAIVLAKDVNRDFRMLEKIIKYTDKEIKLLSTTPCIYKCSDLIYHMNLSSLRDNELKNSFKVKGKFLSHTAIRCQERRLKNLEEYIKSPWIRPEDLKVYEKIGIESFKIDGRDKPEEYNVEVIKAYMNEKYEGNLLYLMQNHYPKNRMIFEDLKNKKENVKGLAVYLDNSVLDEFLRPFEEKKVDCTVGCAECGYCNSWVEKSIFLDKENVEHYLNLLKKEENERISI